MEREERGLGGGHCRVTFFIAPCLFVCFRVRDGAARGVRLRGAKRPFVVGHVGHVGLCGAITTKELPRHVARLRNHRGRSPSQIYERNGRRLGVLVRRVHL